MAPENESESEETRPLKKKISITIDEDLVKQLHKLSIEQSRPLSNYINYVLRRHVDSIFDNDQPDDATAKMVADSKRSYGSKSNS